MRPFGTLLLIPMWFTCLPVAKAGPESRTRHPQTPSQRNSFPISPDASLTPGKFCERPSQYRYAERIGWCKRDVSRSTKARVIATYDARLGFRVGDMNRQEFKIDHYIPLCMGGSNAEENLWPQHQTVYSATDPIEQRLCELVAAGTMRQVEAVDLIRQSKADLAEARRLTLRYSTR